MAKLYTDDAVLILPPAPVRTGKPAIREWIDRFVQNREVAFHYENLQASLSREADLGYTVSRYEVVITRPDGSRVQEKGRWVQVWRKPGAGGWKLVLEMSSPEASPDPPQPAPPRLGEERPAAR